MFSLKTSQMTLVQTNQRTWNFFEAILQTCVFPGLLLSNGTHILFKPYVRGAFDRSLAPVPPTVLYEQVQFVP